MTTSLDNWTMTRRAFWGVTLKQHRSSWIDTEGRWEILRRQFRKGPDKFSAHDLFGKWEAMFDTLEEAVAAIGKRAKNKVRIVR